jgi:hypothetical protein
VIRLAYATGQAYSAYAIGYCGVADLVIDGNNKQLNASSGTIDGVHYRSYQGTIDNVTVDGASGNGIHIQGHPTWSTYDSYFTRILSARSGLAGFRFGANADDNHLMNLTTIDSGAGGIEIDGAATQSICGFQTYGDLYGIHFKANGVRTRIMDGRIEHCLRDGIFFDGATVMGSEILVSGVLFASNGRTRTTETYSHIRLDNGSSGAWGTTITGCRFDNTYGYATKAHSVLYMNGQPRYTSFVGNNLMDGTLANNGADNLVTITSNEQYVDIVANIGLNDRRAYFQVPTPTAGANAGGSPPVPVVVSRSNDERGTVTFGSGTTPAAGSYVVLTFTQPYGAVPFAEVRPNNVDTEPLTPYVVSVSTTALTIGLRTAAAASQANTKYSVRYRLDG